MSYRASGLVTIRHSRPLLPPFAPSTSDTKLDDEAGYYHCFRYLEALHRTPLRAHISTLR